MPTFYRVHSRVPDGKPKMVIDISLDGPSAQGMAAPARFTEFYSAPTPYKKTVNADLKSIRKAHPFGQHVIQTIEVDADAVAQTEGGEIITGQSSTAPRSGRR